MKILYADGFNIGNNPSKIGGGYTITDEHGTVIMRQTIYKENWTNNEAELLGVLEALKLADSGAEVYTDSMNTIHWVKSGRPKARPDLTPQAQEANNLVKRKNIKLLFIRREENLAGLENEKPRTYKY